MLKPLWLEVEEMLKAQNLPPVASVIGRYYAMDRVQGWDRVSKAYDCLVLGEGNKAEKCLGCYKRLVQKDVSDEFVEPAVIGGERISDGDSIIFFNYRPDRAREITKALTFSDFDGFERKKVLKNIFYVCMTQYDENFDLAVAFRPQHLKKHSGRSI